MKNKIALFVLAAMFAPSAFAAEITPYVGLGLVIDKAGTSAKRVGFNPSAINMSSIGNIPAAFGNAIVVNGGGDMDFDMAFAGEITAGVKIGSVRAELEVALRSASEDGYQIYNGSLLNNIVPSAEISTSTSVQHNSYLVNLYYDFNLSNSNWTPYVGAGIGVGTYKQKATVNYNVKPAMGDPATGETVVADDTLTEFEWQVGLGTIYNFTKNWAMDIGYRFNSSSVSGEFVYAHEIKVGVQYAF